MATEDHWLLGFQWNSEFYYERFLPFGLRTAPYLFNLFAKGLHWILEVGYSWRVILHYLDDFFAILTPAGVPIYYSTFNIICEALGLTIKHAKSAEDQRAEFLGIELNSNLMEARLPPEKLIRIK